METSVTRPVPGFFQGAKPIIRGVFLEAIRRNEFYSVFIIAAVFVLASIVIQVIGIENASTGTFILNLGMTYAWYAANIIVIVLMVKQVPGDIENRTLYPILAKPINRLNYLFGKWAAVTVTGILVYLVLTIFVWIASPKMEDYDLILFLQNIVLSILSIGVLAAFGLLLSLIAPIPVALIISGLVFGLGNKIINMVGARFRESALEAPVNWLLGYMPNFGKLSLITRYTDGIPPLDVPTFLGLVIYSLILTGFFVLVSAAIFSKRPL